VAERPDKADRAAKACGTPQLRDPVRGHALTFRQVLEHPFRRKEAASVPVRALADGHQLDKAHIERAVFGKRRDFRYLIVVYAAHQHGVELDALEPGASCGVQSIERVAKLSDACDAAELFRVECIQTDIQAVESGLFQCFRVFREPRPVRRHGKLLHTLDAAQTAYQLIYAAPHERFAAGQAHLGHAERHRRADDFFQLLEGENGAVRQARHAVFAHAVHAAAVAQVGHRKPQIFDCSAVPVFHFILTLSAA